MISPKVSSLSACFAALALLLMPLATWPAVLTFGTPVDIGGGQVEVSLELKLGPLEILSPNAMDAFLTLEPNGPIGLKSGGDYTDGFQSPVALDHASFFFLSPTSGKVLSSGPVLIWTFDTASDAPPKAHFMAELDLESLSDPFHPVMLFADSAASVVPEPGPGVLFFTGLVALGLLRIRRASSLTFP